MNESTKCIPAILYLLISDFFRDESSEQRNKLFE